MDGSSGGGNTSSCGMDTGLEMQCIEERAYICGNRMSTTTACAIQIRRRHHFLSSSSASHASPRLSLFPPFPSTYATQICHIHSHIPHASHHGHSTPLHSSCQRNTDRYPLRSQSMLSVSPSPIPHHLKHSILLVAQRTSKTPSSQRILFSNQTNLQ